eukprot:3602664-Amphidinium_carterae.1
MNRGGMIFPKTGPFVKKTHFFPTFACFHDNCWLVWRKVQGGVLRQTKQGHLVYEVSSRAFLYVLHEPVQKQHGARDQSTTASRPNTFACPSFLFVVFFRRKKAQKKSYTKEFTPKRNSKKDQKML